MDGCVGALSFTDNVGSGCGVAIVDFSKIFSVVVGEALTVGFRGSRVSRVGANVS